MPAGALPGFRDFYPTEFAQRAHIMRAWREVARRYAFVEYDGPPLEALELYTRKSGEEIVGQLYAFEDKGGRAVALRPEMTPSLARMVGARANALRKPVRWFSMPQLFRYERQQRGRLREHFQLNVDIIGEPDVTADAELLAVAIDIMRELGLTADDVVARVSDRRILHGYLTSSGVNEDSIPAVYAVIDKLDRQPEDVSDRKLAEIGLAPATRAAVRAVGSASIETVSSALKNWRNRKPVEDFFRYLRYLSALGVSDFVRFDLSIVRGLAYYTGIVFELFDRKGQLRAICGGGRYDDLVQSIARVDLPALGFGMGDVVLAELLRDRGLLDVEPTTPDWWVAGSQEDQVEDAMRVAASLRQAGENVEYSLRPQSLGRQLKVASARGVSRVVILADDFRSSEMVVLKPLTKGGTEERLSLPSLINEVRRFRRPTSNHNVEHE